MLCGRNLSVLLQDLGLFFDWNFRKRRPSRSPALEACGQRHCWAGLKDARPVEELSSSLRYVFETRFEFDEFVGKQMLRSSSKGLFMYGIRRNHSQQCCMKLQSYNLDLPNDVIQCCCTITGFWYYSKICFLMSQRLTTEDDAKWNRNIYMMAAVTGFWM